MVRTGELFKGNSSVRRSEPTRHFPFSRATLKSSARCFQISHIRSSIWLHHRILQKSNIHFTAPLHQTSSMIIIHNFQPSLVIKYYHWNVPDILSGVSKAGCRAGECVDCSGHTRPTCRRALLSPRTLIELSRPGVSCSHDMRVLVFLGGILDNNKMQEI